MTQTKTPPKPSDDKLVQIFHTGKGHGPMTTAFGQLAPGQSIEVSAELAATLTRVYKHVKLASDVIPGGAADPRVARENAMLKAEVEKLNKQLAGGKESGDKALAEAVARAEAAEQKLALAEAGDKAALQAVVKDFLGAGSKKDLETLQDKHKDIVA